MALELIEEQIKRFLVEKESTILCIKGDWGVGKTFMWDRVLQENSESLHLNKYSYVTLFGLNSLKELKQSIFESAISKEFIGTEPDITSYKNNLSSLIGRNWKPMLPFISKLPYLDNSGSAIESLSFLSIKQTLICIDDVERKGESLSIKDVMGLASWLKEKRKCKVIFLLNSSEKGLEDFFKYHEKVIDVELEFSPTAEECASIAYVGGEYADEQLKRFTVLLGIKNIRVLNRIKRLVDIVIPYLEEYEVELKEDAIRTLVLLTWSYLCSMSDDAVPGFNFVTTISNSFDSYFAENDSNEIEKSWFALLTEYGYSHSDEFDVVLARVVETGYVNPEHLKVVADAKNSEILASKADSSFTDAWKLYHHSFDNNQDTVINALYDGVKSFAVHITPLNLNGTVRLFRDLGEDIKANEIIDIFIQARKESPRVFDIAQYSFKEDINDDVLIAKFTEAYVEYSKLDSLEVVLKRRVIDGSYDVDDTTVLEKASVQELYTFFTSNQGTDITPYVRLCLKEGQRMGSDKGASPFLENTVEALRLIASESKINERRVKANFGITTENTSS